MSSVGSSSWAGLSSLRLRRGRYVLWSAPGCPPIGGCTQASTTADSTGSSSISSTATPPAASTVGVQIESAILLYRR